MKIFETIRETLQDKEVKIVLPEGEEPRILQATKRLVKETSITPVLLGNPEKIRIYLEIEGVTEGYEVIDPQNCSCFEEMVAAFVERRKGKITEDEARKLLKEDVNYFGVMLVYLGKVQGMVSGAILQQALFVQLFKLSKHFLGFLAHLVPFSWFAVMNAMFSVIVQSILTQMLKH